MTTLNAPTNLRLLVHELGSSIYVEWSRPTNGNVDPWNYILFSAPVPTGSASSVITDLVISNYLANNATIPRNGPIRVDWIDRGRNSKYVISPNNIRMGYRLLAVTAVVNLDDQVIAATTPCSTTIDGEATPALAAGLRKALPTYDPKLSIRAAIRGVMKNVGLIEGKDFNITVEPMMPIVSEQATFSIRRTSNQIINRYLGDVASYCERGRLESHHSTDINIQWFSTIPEQRDKISQIFEVFWILFQQMIYQFSADQYKTVDDIKIISVQISLQPEAMERKGGTNCFVSGMNVNIMYTLFASFLSSLGTTSSMENSINFPGIVVNDDD